MGSVRHRPLLPPAGLRGLLGLGLSLGLALVGQAQTIVFHDFSSTSGLSLNDSIVSGGVLTLASNANDRRGSVFTTAQYSTSGFSTVFEFRISSPGGLNDGIAAGADGLTFVMQSVSATALGGSGEGMGYGARGGTAAISNSIAVEFDTFKNSWDADSNHVGIDLNGNLTSVAAQAVGTAFDNGVKRTVWIDYNGSVLEVRLSDTGLRPTSALLTHTINIASTIGGASDAYVGFTGATGNAFGDHELLGWAYSDTFLANGIAAVPEPGTVGLLGLGVMLLVGARRFRRAH